MNFLRHVTGCFRPGNQAINNERACVAGETADPVGVRTALTTQECSRHDAGLTFSASPSFTASILASTCPAGALDSTAACFTTTTCSAAAALEVGPTSGAPLPSGPNSNGCEVSSPPALPDVSTAAAVAADQMRHSTAASEALHTAPAGRLLGLLPTVAGSNDTCGEARPASGPGSSPPMFGDYAACRSDAGAAATAAPLATELQVAFSAYNTRDICAWDPTMRIRHLKAMASGPSAVVYKGTWQGMLVAVRFTLLKGSCGPVDMERTGGSSLGASSPEPAAAQAAYRRLCTMMASHCTPQRSHCTRVYACDVSRVARAAVAGSSAWGPCGDSGTAAAGLTVVACDWAAGAEPHDTAGFSSPQPHLLPRSTHSSMEHSAASSSSDAEQSQGRVWVAEQRFSSLAGSRLASGALISTSRADDLEQSGSSCCGSGGSSTCSAATASSAARGSVGGAGGVVGCGAAPSASSSAYSSAHLPGLSGLTPAAASPSASHFHFSSVLCGCPPPSTGSASPTASAPQPPPQPPLQPPLQHEEQSLSTLQGLLAYLRAAPGDYLLHTVLEQGCCGDLRHGVRCGVYDGHGSGPLGPRGAMTNLVHSARGVAAGLQQLHQAGEVHGGLCPGNVLLQWSRPNGAAHAEEGGEVMMLAGAAGAAEAGQPRMSRSGSGGRKKCRRGLFAARITDCGVRRLVLGPEWQQQLGAHADLLCCTAPELLPASCADSTGGSRQASAEPQWQPHHDIYSFGCLLFLMCTGGLPNAHRLHAAAAVGTGAYAEAAGTGACSGPAATATTWPANVWPPLRSLGEACMAADPALRPTASRVVQVLLLWESRLCSSRQQQLLQYDATLTSPQQPARLNVSAPDFPALAAAAASRSGGGSSGQVPVVAKDGTSATAVAAAGAGCSTVPSPASELHPHIVEQQPQQAMRLPGRTGGGGARGAGGCLVLGVGSGAFSHTLDSVAEAELTACGSGCSSGTEERLKLDAEKRPARFANEASPSVARGGRVREALHSSAASSPAHAHVSADQVRTPARCVGLAAAAARQEQQPGHAQACVGQLGEQENAAAAAAAATAMGQPVAASRSREGRSRVLQMESMQKMNDLQSSHGPCMGTTIV